MNKVRPVNLALTKFSFPLAAIASITHRITGVVLFAAVALLLYLADLALSSEEGFARAASLVATPGLKVLLWLVLTGLIYHTVAGIRHLLLDLHIGDSKLAGKRTAQLTFLLTALLAIALGVWLW